MHAPTAAQASTYPVCSHALLAAMCSSAHAYSQSKQHVSRPLAAVLQKRLGLSIADDIAAAVPAQPIAVSIATSVYCRMVSMRYANDQGVGPGVTRQILAAALEEIARGGFAGMVARACHLTVRVCRQAALTLQRPSCIPCWHLQFCLPAAASRRSWHSLPTASCQAGSRDADVLHSQSHALGERHLQADGSCSSHLLLAHRQRTAAVTKQYFAMGAALYLAVRWGLPSTLRLAPYTCGEARVLSGM